MKPEILKQVIKHGENLGRIFPAVKGLDPVKLCRQLRKLEREASDNAVKLCNGDITQDAYEITGKKLREKLEKLLRFQAAGVAVFLNGDPRGYALKIDDAWLKANGSPVIHTDMGGYGIIAPEFTAHE